MALLLLLLLLLRLLVRRATGGWGDALDRMQQMGTPLYAVFRGGPAPPAARQGRGRHRGVRLLRQLSGSPRHSGMILQHSVVAPLWWRLSGAGCPL